jgi:hypothetical protein
VVFLVLIAIFMGIGAFSCASMDAMRYGTSSDWSILLGASVGGIVGFFVSVVVAVIWRIKSDEGPFD